MAEKLNEVLIVAEIRNASSAIAGKVNAVADRVT
jgi:hypothetical protein